MTISSLGRSLRSALSRKNPRVVVFVAIAMIPLIYAGLLTAANFDPTHHLNSVPAMVVNEDTGAKAADGSALALGNDLAEKLTSSTSDSNFAWSAADADTAARDLASGAVYVVLTIPAGFSSNVASIGGNDSAAATAATLTVQTNDGANLIIGNVASTLGSTVTQTLEKQVGEKYLQNVYLGFTNLHTSVQQAADGATQLADGAARAADGSSELVVGLSQLRTGTAQLAAGAANLRTGAVSAASGAAALSSGLQQLAQSTGQLPAQTSALNDGAKAVAAGAHQVNGGAAALASGANDLAVGTIGLRSGAAQAEAGAQALATGAGGVAQGSATARDSAARLAQGATTLASATAPLASGAESLDDGLAALLARYSSLSDAERLARLTALKGAAGAVATGAKEADAGGHKLAVGSAALVGNDHGGLTALAAGAATLSGGASGLATGAHALAEGAASLDAGAQTLKTGAQALTSGTTSLDTGATQLAGGVGTFADRVGPLTDGIAHAASGAVSLASGTTTLASGADALAGASASAARGSADAMSGSRNLENGINSLKAGSETLGGGLAEGAAKVPSYTNDQAAALSAVAAAPVGMDADRANQVPAYGYGLAPYFLALALWVGALAFYLMAAPLRSRLLASRRPAWLIALRSYIPGALMAVAQGVLAALTIRFVVGIEAANLPGLIGIAVLTSLTFVAINQALIALLDAPGRFLALLMIVLQLSAAGGTYPVETAPVFFQAVHGVLPLTGAVTAFRSLIAGGGLGVAHAVIVLALWLVGALAVTVLAAARRRGVQPTFRNPEPPLGELA
ncbi:YhgE/Pip domain-containing protein [Rathayibacter toxicus]|uniref:YhgE/Pip domain-containing protein n=1 Tax=Rathayibacter toxicus TaxID=145458 RepID=UPI001C044D2D|nr:YhgE/Pip domain-containing protein [Rathayibacter toxicus]QWL29492.1 DUF3533 domain-containing protein [Rathayibacter toxicus]